MKTQLNSSKNLEYFKIVKGVANAYLLTLIMFLALALIMCLTNMTEDILPKATVVISGISILLSGVKTTKDVKSLGWLHGGLIGLCYVLILLIIKFLASPSFSLELYIIFDLLVGFLIGVMAGVLGVNI